MEIKLRNPNNESFDLHEFVKVQLCLLLKRKNKGLYVKTEEKIGKRIADVYMRDKKGLIHVWEIQNAISPSWKNKMERDYTDLNIIPFTVSLKDITNRWENRLISNLMINKEFNPLQDLREVLKDYII